MLNKRKNGFTLPEMLVVICIASMLLTFFLHCFFTISMQHKERSAMLELQDNLMLAAEILETDISRSTAVLEYNSQMLELKTPEGTVQYTLGLDQQAEEHFYALEGNILYRRENNQKNRQPVANFIETLTFVCLDSDGRPIETAEQCCAVQVHITGSWKQNILQRKQIVRLAGTMYL